MREEGVSTPRIHRTRWEPFRWFGFRLRRFELNCLFSYIISTSFPNKLQENKNFYYLSLTVVGARSYVFPGAMGNSKLT